MILTALRLRSHADCGVVLLERGLPFPRRPPYSNDEDRFIAIGLIERGTVLVVWTERDEDVIRIISARWATRREREKYLDYMDQQT